MQDTGQGFNTPHLLYNRVSLYELGLLTAWSIIQAQQRMQWIQKKILLISVWMLIHTSGSTPISITVPEIYR